MRWSETPIHLIDFEGHRSYGIVEFGIVTVLGGRIQGTATRLCRPRHEIPAADVAVHHIKASMAASMAPFEDEWQRFVELRRTGPLGAHHAGTEDGLLRGIWPYASAVPDFVGGAGEVATWGPWVDSLRLAQRLIPDRESYQLGGLIADLSLQEELDELAVEHCPNSRRRYHCALYDTLACALVLLYLDQETELASWSCRELVLRSQAGQVQREAAQDELF